MEVTREEMLEFAKQATFHLDDRLVPFDRETLRAEAWLIGYEFARRNEKKQDVEPAPDDAQKPIMEGSWIVNGQQTCRVLRVVGDRVVVAAPSLFGAVEMRYNIADVRPWTLNDTKKGDFLAVDNEMVLISKGAADGVCSYFAFYDITQKRFYEDDECSPMWQDKMRPATEEEKFMLKEQIEIHGLHWNLDKLELEKKHEDNIRATFHKSEYIQLQHDMNELAARVKSLEEQLLRIESKEIPLGGNSCI